MEELHIGIKIREVFEGQDRSKNWFAEKLGCSRDNIYKIFQRKYIDTDLLMRVSVILDYDFFAEYSKMLSKNKPNI